MCFDLKNLYKIGSKLSNIEDNIFHNLSQII